MVAGFLAVPVLAGSASVGIAGLLDKDWGFERSSRKAPPFYALVALGTTGGSVLSVLTTNTIQLLGFVALINGIAAAPFLIITMLISSDRHLMGEHRNGHLAITLGAAAIVPDDRETLMSQRPHQGEYVTGHRTFGIRSVIRRRRRRGGLTVAAYVRTHHRVSSREQYWRYPVPGRVCSRMPVQQHHRRNRSRRCAQAIALRHRRPPMFRRNARTPTHPDSP